MKQKIIAGLTVTVCLLFIHGYIPAFAGHEEHGAAKTEKHQIKDVVNHILTNNADFVKKHRGNYFKPFKESQHPKATVVSCSDSRVHMHAIDSTPDNDLFVVRNIGNQISTAEGSVEYGVHHLHTPVLMILGHVRCGAIRAASGDYSKESAAIRKELDTISIRKEAPWGENVKANVINQVADAMKKFEAEVKEGKLLVIGAVYDFANDLHQGDGKLSVISINGDTDAEKIRAFTADATKQKSHGRPKHHRGKNSKHTS